MRGKRVAPKARLFVTGAAAIFLLAGCNDRHTLVAPVDQVATLSRDNAPDVIPGRFIVTLQPRVDPAALTTEYGLEPDYTYTTVLNGFAGSIGDAARAGLLRDARVVRVEPDSWVNPTETPTVQEGATWGLDRIDQRMLPLNEEYRYTHTGEGVTVYIIDSGIHFDHAEFEGRASNGYDFVWNDPDESDGNKGSVEGGDCMGHGTHVAGTVGGKTFGVAKEVNLISVRVFGCKGGSPHSRVIAAVEWVTENHSGDRTAVANMSLSGGGSSAGDDATRAMIGAGVATAAAAGNDGRENGACSRSPARVSEAMTIGSTDLDDRVSTFSNWGDCTDWFAPGQSITSAGHASEGDTRVSSGTSMAAPHVAGVAALYLHRFPYSTPAEVFGALRLAATPDVVTVAVPEYHPRNGKVIGYSEPIPAGYLLYSLIEEEGNAPPATPTELIATAMSSNLIELRWNPADENEDGFEIQRRTSASGDEYRTIARTEPGVSSYADDALDPATHYLYRVRAFSESGTSGWEWADAKTGDGGSLKAAFRYDCDNSERCFFYDESTGTPTRWLYDFQNGDLQPHASTLTWFAAGEYTVTLTIWDAEGRSDFTQKTVICEQKGRNVRCR